MPFAILLLLLALFLPVLLFFLFYQMVSISFVKLGIPRSLVFFLFLSILVGSLVNIPVWHTQAVEPGDLFRLGHVFFLESPQVTTTVIAVNVGGALIPLLLSLYLLRKAPLLKMGLGVLIVALVTHWLARVVPGEGIFINPFIPPLVSAGAALVLAKKEAAPVAYVSGTLGTLIGTDLLNLRELAQSGGTFLSIGGAGVFDGIFLVGVIAAFLSPGRT